MDGLAQAQAQAYDYSEEDPSLSRPQAQAQAYDYGEGAPSLSRPQAQAQAYDYSEGAPSLSRPGVFNWFCPRDHHSDQKVIRGPLIFIVPYPSFSCL